MIIAILAAALLEAQAAGTTVAPPATAIAAPPTKAAAANEDDKVVCKSEQVTGSHFSTRVCHTKHDWAQIEKDSRDELMDQQSQSYRNPSNGH